ncbi:DUF2516 family protein [Aeromicrobium sp.]|uniref:DUF2516 family protein n=1 Tax=Aeromicrobium sp. TaxID=1871063 RepID=UPI003C696338
MFDIQSNVMVILSIALFAAKGFALVDCVARPSVQFGSLDTLPKQTWIILLVLAVLAHLLWWSPLSLLNLLGTVAALVYLAQVRGSQH